MNTQANLTDLETNNLSAEVRIKEFVRRVRETVIAAGLSFSQASAFQTSLMNCGFSYLEALFIVCGPAMLDCTLLSKRTQDFAQRMAEREMKKLTEEDQDTCSNTLNQLITDIDLICFQHYLQEDSVRLTRTIEKMKAQVK